MDAKRQRAILLVVMVILMLVLAGLLGVMLWLRGRQPMDPPETTLPTQTTAPDVTTTAPTTTAPVETATRPPETTAEPTTEPTTAPTTEPQPEYFTLSFAGDCTLGNQHGRTGAQTFLGTVGDNYAHPFLDVQPFFSTDDATFINLECALTDGGTPNTNKQFTFKGPAAYTNILTMGSVEFANVVNNHAKDYGTSGYKDTLANLDAAGVFYAEQDKTCVFTTESGLTVGVYSAYFPYSVYGVKTQIKEMRSQGAEIIVVAVHWGEEYDYHPNSNEKYIGRLYIDAGADIVWGHHPHVLQDIEHYKEGVIYYSLGNFSFGGNMSPPDKDTAVLQQQVIRQPDGTVELGELKIIPCHVSGILSYGNDYQPTPMEEGSDAYNRVLSKLDGSWPQDKLYVSYRDDNKTTEPTGEATEPAETPTEPAETPTEPAQTPTEPAQTPTQPAETPTEPTQTPAPPPATEAPQAPADPPQGGTEGEQPAA